MGAVRAAGCNYDGFRRQIGGVLIGKAHGFSVVVGNAVDKRRLVCR